MAIAFESTIRIQIPVGGETVTFVCRQPSAQEVSKFLDTRFETRRNKVRSRVYEARAVLIDKILVDIENAEFRDAEGAVRPLNAQTQLSEQDKAACSAVMGLQVESWKDLIPLNWKASAAMRFEEAAPEENEGN